MQGSKLIDILSTLSNKELNKFDHYINSAFFNKNAHVITLLNAIKKRHPKYDQKYIAKEAVFPLVFPKEKFQEQKLRYVMTDLTKLLENYLSFIEYNSLDVHKNHFLLKALDQRKLDKYFLQTLLEAKKNLDKSTIRDTEYYHLHHLLDAGNYIYNSQKLNRAKIGSNLGSAIDNLNLFYLTKSLKYYCELLNREKVFSSESSETFFNNIISLVEQNDFMNIPAIAIYYEALMCLRTSQEKHYYNLIELLNKHSDKFPQFETRDMYALAQNYCIEYINKGDQKYMRELFLLYQQLLDKEIMYIGKYIPQWDYKNIVTVGLRLEEYQWTNQFIHEYVDKMDPDVKHNAFTYNLAVWHFHKKEFRQTLKMLFNVEFTDVVYQLDSKSLLLKCYYELESIEPLLSLIDSFKVYLSRNRFISKDLKTAYSNQIKFIKRLVSYKVDGRGNIENIAELLDTLTPIVDTTWLHKKVDELKKAGSVA